MQGFCMVNGDVSIVNGEIEMVSGAELLRQTVEMVLNTNKGEWWLDPDEGITYNNILGKNSDKRNDKTSTVSTVDKELNDLLARRLDGVS